jgi:hypothetical protein
MIYRTLATVSLTAAVLLTAACAQRDINAPPVVHRPLFESTYSHDLVSPREPPKFVIEPVRERPGYVWTHSYYRWDGHDYVHVPSEWIPAKSDSRYVDATWERHGDGWHFKPGHWVSI